MSIFDLERWWETFQRDMERVRKTYAGGCVRAPEAIACPDRPSCEGGECAECRCCEIHCTCGAWDE